VSRVIHFLEKKTNLIPRFLLFASAVAMGGVGIWSMHFIGNNSLTIIMANGEEHQLSYGTGFTFASLFVAIVAMFLAFAFVGITEEAKIRRIIPSGIIAGVR
jgi:NO-binding membrane sensor protein with MHYT domain